MTGCSPQAGVVFGKTTPAELQARYGVPVRSYTPADRASAEIQVFPHSDSFQVEEGKVVAHFRDPSSRAADQDERSLQYWRHRWRGKNPGFEEIPGTRDVHGQSLYLLKETESGSAVVYDSTREEVVRVLQYGN